jgi:hypothetical protein
MEETGSPASRAGPGIPGRPCRRAAHIHTAGPELIGGADPEAKPGSELAQDGIADSQAALLVEPCEAVDVEQDDGHGMAWCSACGNGRSTIRSATSPAGGAIYGGSAGATGLGRHLGSAVIIGDTTTWAREINPGWIWRAAMPSRATTPPITQNRSGA